MNGQELQALLADHQCFHSDLQIDRFILAKEGGTPYGCYKQALRELSKRYGALKSLLLDRAILQVDIDQTRSGLRLAQHKMRMDGLERTLKDTCREFARFYAHAKTLKAQIGELTPEKRAELDEEMWEHHLKSQMALDLLSVGHIRGETIATVQTMPEDFRQAVRDVLDVKEGDRCKQHELVGWYLDQKPVVVEQKELMAPTEVMKFLEQGS